MTTENRYIHNALKQVRLHAACSRMQGFSISGLATYLQFPEMNFCVDMGECPLSATPIDHVFLTHAHGDHARCIMRHNSLRKMMGVESQGMILSAVDSDESLSVVTTTKDVKPGSQVG